MPTPNDKLTPADLAAVIDERDLTQHQAAEMIGVTSRHIIRLLNGEHQVRRWHVDALMTGTPPARGASRAVRFSTDEDELLRLAIAKGHSLSEIARALGRGRSAVYRRAIALGIHTPARRPE